MPGGPTMKIMGLGGPCREVKGMESLGVCIAGATGPGRLGRWEPGKLGSWDAGILGSWDPGKVAFGFWPDPTILEAK